MSKLRIIPDPLTDPRVQRLIGIHLQQMRAQSPACSVHALEIEALQSDDIRFFSAWVGEDLVGCGALRSISPDHGEIKSMHVHADHRGRGYAQKILEQIELCARDLGLKRLSLETGSQPEFAAARALYATNGYETCPPFDGYGPDQNSCFMSRKL